MTTSLAICNLALSNLGAAFRMQSIEPPTTDNERYFALVYPHARDYELRRRVWGFAKEYITLTPTAPALTADVERKYRYTLPNECLRVVRQKYDEWEPYGKNMVLSAKDASLDLLIVKRVGPDQFPADFVDVLAWGLAWRSAEKITQSNSKKEEARVAYKEALAIAAQLNSFDREPDNYAEDDAQHSWVNARHIGV
jgi:hypothetical protein